MCTEYYKINDYLFCEVNNLLMITTFVHTTYRQGDVTYAYGNFIYVFGCQNLWRTMSFANHFDIDSNDVQFSHIVV